MHGDLKQVTLKSPNHPENQRGPKRVHTLQCQPVSDGRKRRCLLTFNPDDSDDVIKKERDDVIKKGKDRKKGRATPAPCKGRKNQFDDTVLFCSGFHALEKELATHSSVLAWRIPGTGQPSLWGRIESDTTETT